MDAVEVGTASGSTVEAKEGQDIVLKLAGPSPGALGGWKVVSTDRTFGYPTATWTQGEGAVGESGHSTFVWHTKSPLSMVGSHEVTLEIDRGHGDGVTKFEFTANITR